MSSAVFGLVGVFIGSLSTSVLTIYRERLATHREQAARDEQYERDRKATRDTFQRDSILALQAAVSDMIHAAYQELDRILAELKQTGEWAARTWETPTATGWSDAVLRLELSQARVFDDELRALAGNLRILAGDSIWAESLSASKSHSQKMEPVYRRFNKAITDALPSLY
jgi:hypothetical protein